MKVLHIYADGSTLNLMTSRELISIPIWKGQRIVDNSHANNIRSSIGSNVQCLDSGYSIVKYKEETADGKMILQSYLIDGQHRASIIRDYYNSTVCEPDFNVTCTEKIVESETDAIEYFNKINNVKAQQWKMDPNLLINKYISAIEKKYNTNKKCLLIRPDSTMRPYLSAAKLRDEFKNHVHLLNTNTINKFIEHLAKHNDSLVNNFEIELSQLDVKDVGIKEKAVGLKFGLAYDTKLKWVKDILVLTNTRSDI
jgi:hypothetical protein